MALPKNTARGIENPHAGGLNMEALIADPRVVIHRRPPGHPITPFESDLRVVPGTDVLELLGRRPGADDDDSE